VAGDDEQRVVDADTETDHHAEDQGELRHVHEGREHTDRRGADEDADECGDDRQAHRDDGAERDQEHDDGDSDSDELTARVLLCELRHLPGELDADPAPAGMVGHLRRIGVLGVAELVDCVRDVEVAGLPVRAGRARCDTGGVVAVSEFVADLADSDRVRGVVEAAVVGVEHDA